MNEWNMGYLCVTLKTKDKEHEQKLWKMILITTAYKIYDFCARGCAPSHGQGWGEERRKWYNIPDILLQISAPRKVPWKNQFFLPGELLSHSGFLKILDEWEEGWLEILPDATFKLLIVPRYVNSALDLKT